MASPRGYLADVRAQHIMLDIGGGDSFTDIYPDKRFAYIVGSKLVPLIAGVPLVLSPQTIGPFSRQPHTRVSGWICTRAAHVFARDPISLALTRRIAPRAKVSEVIDVAFALPFTRPTRAPDAKIKVGFSVSGLMLAGGHVTDNEYGLGFDFGALTRRLVTDFLALPNVEVHLIAHVYAPHMPRDDDARAIDQLHAEIPATIRAPDFASPSEAKSYISGLDFLTGGRMHATIAAFSSGVPVVPISYSNKFEGLYAGLNYPHLVNAKGMGTDEAYARIMGGFHNRADLAADIARAGPGIETALNAYVDELVRQFEAALKR
nr:polysaccharide pyruvyl transferase family protein [Polymorphobacter multimanifer]